MFRSLKQDLRTWKKLENDRKTRFWGGTGKIGVYGHFSQNRLTSSIEYESENPFLGLKPHPEPFKHIKFNEF